ncbi:C40 family peptidase [Brachybacterium sp. AOP3-A1-3]|uniref:C40 family peptidase n=1 Tax=Brachybacterium sp. AOP3-A1-3 TaxID=3457699 RepID=UPI004033A0BF
MSNTVNNTHRRSMRTVTPVVRAGRATAGAAMTAAMLFGGAAAATAEPQAEAPVAPQAGPAVIAPVAAPAVEIPVAGVAADVTTADATTEAAPTTTTTADAPSFAPAGGSISVEVGPTEAEIAAAEAAAEEERAAEEAAQAEAAEAEAQDQQQTETRDEDDSADRSNERTGTSNDSTESNDSSSSNNSGESSSSRESSSSSDSSSEKKKEKSAPAPSASKGSSILATARSGIGTPYVFGGTSTSGWDCSGFVQWVYAQHGIDLPRGANAQGASGTVIPRSEAKPGDLVYKPGHIGIYAGGNKFVDAGNSRVDTTERNIYSGSWTFVRVGS